MPIKPKKTDELNRKKILIVEDELSLQRALQMKFLSVGFDVSIANNGQVALALMEKKKFDIILLDLIMPVLNGFEFLEELKKIGDRTPVLVSTNLSQKNDMKKIEDFAVVGYLVKNSTTISSLVEQVKKAVGA